MVPIACAITGARLVMGNALVGRLYHALLQRNVPLLLSTEVASIRSTADASAARP
jgi:hypothetical protein